MRRKNPCNRGVELYKARYVVRLDLTCGAYRLSCCECGCGVNKVYTYALELNCGHLEAWWKIGAKVLDNFSSLGGGCKCELCGCLGLNMVIDQDAG
ncbi:uncharacterized protein DS421_11g334710 [Arachis hypogaea]|nr:uncharacterized protein DS421_11g334710 [Arachis hypogaea]